MSRRTRIEKNLYESERADGRTVYEVGYRDSAGRQRWQVVRQPGLRAARAQRDELLARRGKGERVVPSPRLRFGEAAERWLAGPVSELRRSTRDAYTYALRHALARWQRRRLDSIEPDDCMRLTAELRREGLAESYIASVLGCANQVFRFARRHLGWQRTSPVADLLRSERPSAGNPERAVYEGDELEQVIAAAGWPWNVLFRLASVVGARESELLGLWWQDLELDDLDAATIRFTHQVDRRGKRTELKTAESRAVLPLPRSTARTLLEHKARSPRKGPRSFVFATRNGTPLGQRATLRALYRAQLRARWPDGTPTFPQLFKHDERGNLVVDVDGEFRPRRVRRRELDPPLPDFHSIRHAAAMACGDVEEARDLLRHKNSGVTQAVYRAHFGDQRRELLRARLEARHGSVEALVEAEGRGRPRQTPELPDAEVVDLRDVRERAQ
jgi:integrase